MTRYGMQESEMGELSAIMKAELEGKLVKDEVFRITQPIHRNTLLLI